MLLAFFYRKIVTVTRLVLVKSENKTKKPYYTNHTLILHHTMQLFTS